MTLLILDDCYCCLLLFCRTNAGLYADMLQPGCQCPVLLFISPLPTMHSLHPIIRVVVVVVVVALLRAGHGWPFGNSRSNYS